MLKIFKVFDAPIWSIVFEMLKVFIVQIKWFFIKFKVPCFKNYNFQNTLESYT